MAAIFNVSQFDPQRDVICGPDVTRVWGFVKSVSRHRNRPYAHRSSGDFHREQRAVSGRQLHCVARASLQFRKQTTQFQSKCRQMFAAALATEVEFSFQRNQQSKFELD
jgi:hypothetical protein